MSSESPEQLLDAFKAAALSVTKLYKTSAAAQAKARADGYQDCLDDILSFLDKGSMGLSDGEGWRIRRWATERLEGRESPPADSDDELEKAESMVSPELHRSTSARQASPVATRNEVSMRDSAPPVEPVVLGQIEEDRLSQNSQQQQEQQHDQKQSQQQRTPEPTYVVPSQETFNFQAPFSHTFPPEGYLNLANLDLSDSHTTSNPASAPLSRASRTRQGNPPRTGTRTGAHLLGRGAGQKRRLNLDLGQIFDLGSLGHGTKDYFGGGKRPRHT